MISQAPLLQSQYESVEKFQEALVVAQGIVDSAVREKRNALLAASDWTQSNDSPLTEQKKQEWAAYRQALRDLPAGLNLDYETGFVIDESSFPAKPEEVA